MCQVVCAQDRCRSAVKFVEFHRALSFLHLWNLRACLRCTCLRVRAVPCPHGDALGICPSGMRCIADTPCWALNNGMPTRKVSTSRDYSFVGYGTHTSFLVFVERCSFFQLVFCIHMQCGPSQLPFPRGDGQFRHSQLCYRRRKHFIADTIGIGS